MIGQTPNDMRTPARRVRGLGAARSGTKDFWHQRMTGFAGIFLSIALIVIVISMLGRSHAAAVQILGSPIVAVILLLFILASVYHMWIGMQEIILDYVHADKYKFLSLMLNTFFCVAVGLASAFAILKLSFGV
ncbi:MAG: succinate dehydrogenase, hydrophobic membrane anchor protein [Pseudolabrys sp.]|jgi:succinate dehydrogenase / fumarate reductase membrane anchor subunit